MSIWASTLIIEDERQWMADMERSGIGVTRVGGEPSLDDHDAPIVYQGSHVLPEMDDARGGALSLAIIPPHVRFWRDNPDSPTNKEPDGKPTDPFLRLEVQQHPGTYHHSLGEATVILTLRQATRLRDELSKFVSYFEESQ